MKNAIFEGSVCPPRTGSIVNNDYTSMMIFNHSMDLMFCFQNHNHDYSMASSPVGDKPTSSRRRVVEKIT